MSSLSMRRLRPLLRGRRTTPTGTHTLAWFAMALRLGRASKMCMGMPFPPCVRMASRYCSSAALRFPARPLLGWLHRVMTALVIGWTQDSAASRFLVRCWLCSTKVASEMPSGTARRGGYVGHTSKFSLAEEMRQPLPGTPRRCISRSKS